MKGLSNLAFNCPPCVLYLRFPVVFSAWVFLVFVPFVFSTNVFHLCSPLVFSGRAVFCRPYIPLSHGQLALQIVFSQGRRTRADLTQPEPTLT